MTKAVLCYIAATLSLAGCSRHPRDLVQSAKQMDAFVNAHDLDGYAGLITDDVMVMVPDGSMYHGRDSVRAWMAGLMAGFRVESEGWTQSGDTVRWRSTVHSDAFNLTGVNPIKTNTMAVFAGNRIRYFEAFLEQESINKMRFVHFYADVVNGGDVEAIDRYVAEDIVEHQAVPPGTPKGRAGVKAYFRMLRGEFPDLHGTPALVLADGDCVLVWATWEGTKKGKKISWTTADVVRLVGGKAVEHWGTDDMADRLKESRGN